MNPIHKRFICVFLTICCLVLPLSGLAETADSSYPIIDAHLHYLDFLQETDGFEKLAAEYNIPVLIHHNIGPSYTDDPLYLTEMKNALAYNRDTVIIWAHTGISRRVQQSTHIQVVEEMLQENPNLYYDISWVVFDDYINKDEGTRKAWADLLMKYPDRFMIGSDKVGHWDGYEGEIRKYYPLVDLLDEETRLMVTQTNILNLIHVDPVTMQRVEELKPAA